MKLHTIGHSTHPIEVFIGMLKSFQIETMVDIRTVPKSRYNPQFTQENLCKSLQAVSIEYVYMKDLGGLRKARKDSPNGAWRNSSFRGYADYMLTDTFKDTLNHLIDEARKKRCAIMCAESVPWRCHRSLVSDALTVKDIQVEHIMAESKSSQHKMTDFAQMIDGELLYPPDTNYLPGLSV